MVSNTPVITQAHISKACSYEEFKSMINDLFLQGKVTGLKQSAALLEYSKLNLYRMNRWDKTTILNSSLIAQLQQVKDKWIWLTLTEGWCPDSAQIMPVVAKMTQVNKNISLKFLLRDENPEVMDQYLTNGTRSIPKLICLQEATLEEVGTWGPRPQPAQQMVIDYKRNPQLAYSKLAESIQIWYTRDKAQTVQKEFELLISRWRTKSE